MSPKVRIDLEKCDGCGACAAACPVGVFRRVQDLPGDLVKQVRELEIPVLTCRQETDAGNLVLSCLATLSAELLVAMALAGQGKTVVLNGTDCARCPGGILTLLEDRLRTAVRFLQILGLGPRLRLVTSAADLRTASPGKPALSRRELFSLLKAETVKAVDAIARSRSHSRGQHPGPLPPDRAVLISEMRSASLPGDTIIPGANGLWMNWEVGAECDGCSLCVALCPTGAWSASREDGYQELAFRCSHCTGCGLCQELCPRAAIRSPVPVKLADVLRDAVETKRRHRLHLCPRCNRPFLSSDQDFGVCPECEKQRRLGDAVWRLVSPSP